MPQPTSADNDDSRAMFGFPAIGRKQVSAAFDAVAGWCQSAGWSYRIRLKGNLATL